MTDCLNQHATHCLSDGVPFESDSVLNCDSSDVNERCQTGCGFLLSSKMSAETCRGD